MDALSPFLDRVDISCVRFWLGFDNVFFYLLFSKTDKILKESPGSVFDGHIC